MSASLPQCPAQRLCLGNVGGLFDDMQIQPYCSGQIMCSLIVTSTMETDQGVGSSGLWEQRGAPFEITDTPEVVSEIASLPISLTPTLFLGTLIFKFFHPCPQILLLLLHPSSASSPAFVLVRINASHMCVIQGEDLHHQC